MKWRSAVGAVVAAGLLAACGGGGGGSGGTGSGEQPPGDFPVFVASGSFQLPSVAEPPDRSAINGTQRGQVRVGAGVAPPAGTLVELLNASNPAQPTLIASTVTDATGAFSITGSGTSAPVERWLRVTLGNGVQMRAFATGWTEVTPATDVVVTELVRLRKAGAFDARELTISELDRSQASLTLVWLGRHAAQVPAAATAMLLQEMRFQWHWNRWLARMAAVDPAVGTGDIAALMPVSDPIWQTTVTDGAGPATPAEFRSNCFTTSDLDLYSCGVYSSSQPDLGDTFRLDLQGIYLRTESGDGTDVVISLLEQVGELALLEFPYVVGTRVLFNDSRMVLSAAPTIHASVRIVRRTYAPEATMALNAAPHAVRVLLDYEIALLNTATNEQLDLLAREERWFGPGTGPILRGVQALARSGNQVSSNTVSVRANSIAGVVGLAPVVPFAGVADSVARPLRHTHAAHAAAIDRIYVATPNNGGQVLELEASTLATLRTLDLGVTPRRLALSSDGARLYVGLDSGAIAEHRTSDFGFVRTTTPLSSPDAGLLDRFYDLAVDPFDAGRVLAFLGSSTRLPSAAVVTFKDGALQYRDAPRYNASGWGWGYYTPVAIAWSSVANEFFAPGFQGSSYQFNRFSASGSAFGELSRVDSTEVGSIEVGGEIVGSMGSVFSAVTFIKQRQLGLEPLRLDRCLRLDATSTMCRVASDPAAPPNLVLLGQADGVLVGVYRPVVIDDANGCPGTGTRVGSFGLDDVQLTSISGSRLLASSLSTPTGDAFCSLRLWAPRGVGP